MEDRVIQELLTISDNVATTEEWITPLAGAVRGVSAAAAAWKPAPEEPSIWEIVNHSIAWIDWLVAWLDGTDTDVIDWPPVASAGEAAWQETRAYLEKTLASLRERIAALPPDALFERPTPEVTETTRYRAISSLLIHNAYHAGQITKLRERQRAESP